MWTASRNTNGNSESVLSFLCVYLLLILNISHNRLTVHFVFDCSSWAQSLYILCWCNGASPGTLDAFVTISVGSIKEASVTLSSAITFGSNLVYNLHNQGRLEPLSLLCCFLLWELLSLLLFSSKSRSNKKMWLAATDRNSSSWN